MPLNIKNAEVEKLADEVARLAGETKTEAVRRALLERKRRLALRVGRQGRAGSFLRFLEMEVWPHVPESALGKPIDRAELDSILGYGLEGV